MVDVLELEKPKQINFFRQLEESLLHTDFSLSDNSIDDFLHPELFEITPQGKYASRDEIIHWLQQKSPRLRWQLCQFKVTVISPVDVLVCYQANSINDGKVKQTGTLRSSIWTRSMVKNSDNSITYPKIKSHRWRLRFHQATSN